MNKAEKKQQLILFTLGIIPICSTEQIARFFPELKYPNKQASKLLKELERESLVEGRDRRIGESKIWRLSRKGRKTLGIKNRAIPLTVRNVEHILKVGDAYLDLWETGNLSYFQAELRECFTNRVGTKRKYCPDAFFIYEGKAYFLEVQRSYLSRMNWAEKWKIANDFFLESHYQKSSIYELVPNKEDEPIIVVLSDQSNHVVQTGARIQLLMYQQCKQFIHEKKNIVFS